MSHPLIQDFLAIYFRNMESCLFLKKILRHYGSCLESETDQREGVVAPHQLLHPILFQHHDSRQRRALSPGAVLAVHHVALLGAVLAGHQQEIIHLHLQRHGLYHGRDAHAHSLFPGRQRGRGKRWRHSRHTHCSGRRARPSCDSGRRSSSPQPPAALEESGCA